MAVSRRHCSTCGEERRFEQPPCEDGHGSGCPEWVCVECGSAILVAGDVVDASPEAGAFSTFDASRAA